MLAVDHAFLARQRCFELRKPESVQRRSRHFVFALITKNLIFAAFDCSKFDAVIELWGDLETLTNEALVPIVEEGKGQNQPISFLWEIVEYLLCCLSCCLVVQNGFRARSTARLWHLVQRYVSVANTFSNLIDPNIGRRSHHIPADELGFP